VRPLGVGCRPSDTCTCPMFTRPREQTGSLPTPPKSGCTPRHKGVEPNTSIPHPRRQRGQDSICACRQDEQRRGNRIRTICSPAPKGWGRDAAHQTTRHSMMCEPPLASAYPAEPISPASGGRETRTPYASVRRVGSGTNTAYAGPNCERPHRWVSHVRFSDRIPHSGPTEFDDPPPREGVMWGPRRTRWRGSRMAPPPRADGPERATPPAVR